VRPLTGVFARAPVARKARETGPSRECQSLGDRPICYRSSGTRRFRAGSE
jgi:hypothetical protein